jgi:dTDP-4-dehydrorhamnose 3,5-epimerase
MARDPRRALDRPDVFDQTRGFFMKTYHAKGHARAGRRLPCVQDIVGRSELGILRGLHQQRPHDQGGPGIRYPIDQPTPSARDQKTPPHSQSDSGRLPR